MQQYDLIISFTSWKGRIYDESFIHVLLTMLLQKTNAKYKVILVLSTDEFLKKEEELPKKLLEIEKLCNNFEILWTKENTRAYKKYFPTRRAYPEENIMTLDDDSPVKNNLVEDMVKLLKTNPDRIIIGLNPNRNNKDTIYTPRYGMAVYRPNSLYDLDENFGIKYFKDHDDEFLELLAVLNKTHYIGVDFHNYAKINAFCQNKRLATLGGLPANIKQLWDNCFKDHPNLKNIFEQNKKILN